MGNKSPSEHVGPLFEKGHPGGHFGILPNFEELRFLKISPISETVPDRAKRTKIWHPLGNKSPSEHVGPLFEKGHPVGHFEELRFLKKFYLSQKPFEIKQNGRRFGTLWVISHLVNVLDHFLKKVTLAAICQISKKRRSTVSLETTHVLVLYTIVTNTII